MRRRYRNLALATLSVIGIAIALEISFAKMVFVAKSGNVTYDHKAHNLREKLNCFVCHTKTFPLYRGALDFKRILHKVAETGKTSCGQCHRPGGNAFETRGNCKKCHVKPVTDPGGNI